MLKHSLQLSGMTFRARGRRSSKEASRTRAWTSGYDMAAQVAEKGRSFEPNHRTEFQWSEWNVCVADVVPVNPPIDQAKMTMSLSWKPSLWTANWITTSMALASFWGKGTPWERQSDNNGQTTTVRQQESQWWSTLTATHSSRWCCLCSDCRLMLLELHIKFQKQKQRLLTVLPPKPGWFQPRTE